MGKDGPGEWESRTKDEIVNLLKSRDLHSTIPGRVTIEEINRLGENKTTIVPTRGRDRQFSHHEIRWKHKDNGDHKGFYYERREVEPIEGEWEYCNADHIAILIKNFPDLLVGKTRIVRRNTKGNKFYEYEGVRRIPAIDAMKSINLMMEESRQLQKESSDEESR